jgi:hypothetical protein
VTNNVAEAHPILRRTSYDGKNYVVIGRRSTASRTSLLRQIGASVIDAEDEVWTRSRSCIVGIQKALDDESSIFTRSEWERDVIRVASFDKHYFTFKSTVIEEHLLVPSAISERIFDLLVSDGVLRRPTAENLRMYPHRERPSLATGLWIPDQDKRDEWIAVRLLLLEDNRGRGGAEHSTR